VAGRVELGGGLTEQLAQMALPPKHVAGRGEDRGVEAVCQVEVIVEDAQHRTRDWGARRAFGRLGVRLSMPLRM
jgi:hypothetical protein